MNQSPPNLARKKIANMRISSEASIEVDTIRSSFEEDVLSNFEFEVDDVLDIDIYNKFDVYYKNKLQITPEVCEFHEFGNEGTFTSLIQEATFSDRRLSLDELSLSWAFKKSSWSELPTQDSCVVEKKVRKRREKLSAFRASKGGFTLKINADDSQLNEDVVPSIEHAAIQIAIPRVNPENRYKGSGKKHLKVSLPTKKKPTTGRKKQLYDNTEASKTSLTRCQSLKTLPSQVGEFKELKAKVSELTCCQICQKSIKDKPQHLLMFYICEHRFHYECLDTVHERS
jgi:hypothetical protein